MKTTILMVGKTDNSHINTLINDYSDRLKRYKIGFEIQIIPDIKNSKNISVSQQKTAEGRLILNNINESDYVVLLDEHGKEQTSVEMAKWLEAKMNATYKRIVFVIGGPYGFSSELYGRKNDIISLSKLTFSHQMVRLIFIEQLYRSMTIIHHEPYHHE